MWQPNTLIIKLVPVDTLSAGAISHSGVSALHHEVLDDSVEFVSFIMEFSSFFARAVNTEVLSSLGYNLIEQFHNNSTLFVPLFTFLADF
jgi:hypothetical protein